MIDIDLLQSSCYGLNSGLMVYILNKNSLWKGAASYCVKLEKGRLSWADARREKASEQKMIWSLLVFVSVFQSQLLHQDKEMKTFETWRPIKMNLWMNLWSYWRSGASALIHHRCRNGFSTIRSSLSFQVASYPWFDKSGFLQLRLLQHFLHLLDLQRVHSSDTEVETQQQHRVTAQPAPAFSDPHTCAAPPCNSCVTAHPLR